MKKNSRGDTKWIPRHMGSKLTFIYPWIKNSIHLILLRREKFVPAWMFSWSWFWKPTSEFRPSELVTAPSNIWIFRREKNFLAEFFSFLEVLIVFSYSMYHKLVWGSRFGAWGPENLTLGPKTQKWLCFFVFFSRFGPKIRFLKVNTPLDVTKVQRLYK